MHSRAGAVVLLVLVLLVSQFCFVSELSLYDMTYEGDHNRRPENKVRALQVFHESIVISSTQDFIDQGWPGDGTPESPFRISGLNIWGVAPGINISGVDNHFIIEDCQLHPGPTWGEFGIYMSNVENGVITSCSIDNFDTSILLEECTNCQINDTSVNSEWIGLRAINSLNCTTENSDFDSTWGSSLIELFNCTGYQIRDSEFARGSHEDWSWGESISITMSNHTSIVDCTIIDRSSFGNSIGVSFWESSYCHVNRCLIEGNIRIDSCDELRVKDCAITNGFVEMNGYSRSNYDHEFENVTIDGKPLGYFNGINNTSIDAGLYEQLILVGCVQVQVNGGALGTSAVGPIIAWSEYCNVSDYSIDSGENIGMYIESCSSLWMENISIRSEWTPCVIQNCRNTTLVNSMMSSQGDGMQIWNCSRFNVTDCTIQSDYGGLYFVFSESCSVTNTFVNSTLGSPLTLMTTKNCFFVDCELIGSFVDIYGPGIEDWIHAFINVTLNGRNIGYFYSLNDTSINPADYYQLIIVNCSYISIAGEGFSDNVGGLSIAFSEECNVSNIASSALVIQDSAKCSIHDFNLTGETYSYTYAAIYGSSYILVQNLTCISGYSSLFVTDSENVDFVGCNISSGFGVGITLLNSTHCSLTENIIIGTYYGIQLAWSEHCVISDNVIESLWNAIDVYQSANSNITGCVLDDGDLYLMESEQIIIQDCALKGASIIIHGSRKSKWNHTFQNVTVNGRLFGYLFGRTREAIDGSAFGQVMLVDCRDVELSGGEFTNQSNGITVAFSEGCSIADVEITDCYGPGIYVFSSTDIHIEHLDSFNAQPDLFIDESSRVTLVNSTLLSDWGGITLYNTSQCTLSHNSIIGSYIGIEIYESESALIAHNQISNQGTGVNLWRCNGCTVSSNIIESQWVGVDIYTSNEISVEKNYIRGPDVGVANYWSNGTSIIQNTILNTYFGIITESSNHGFYSQNWIANGGGNGIFLVNEHHSNIQYNLIINNDEYGINIESGWSNTIYGNLMARNDLGCAIDSGYDNQWDDGSAIGNHWNGLNNNESVQVDGLANSTDRFPIPVERASFEPPLLSTPLDLELTDGADNETITWIAWTMDSLEYVILQNGESLESGVQNASGPIAVHLSNLYPGVNNYTLALQNGSVLLAFDTVLVLLLNPAVLLMPLVMITVSATIVIALVVVEIRKRDVLN